LQICYWCANNKVRLKISLKSWRYIQKEQERRRYIFLSTEFRTLFGEAAKTALGFFWKSGWAFVLGYFISAMIQAFVPKSRLTPYLGGVDAKSVGLATAFGAISSSCSFAALATARALVMKSAHFVSRQLVVMRKKKCKWAAVD